MLAAVSQGREAVVETRDDQVTFVGHSAGARRHRRARHDLSGVCRSGGCPALGTELVLLEGRGHVVSMEVPETVAELIQRHAAAHDA